ncbi:MAG TPA: CHAT domain-containing tetratricopeptide repeat protein [Thermoanaerobaculia bacterium]|nr:CHAT domain-containing tetratricopeptide repeat protein [Thermoanaerobaculia bacterium]
MERSLDPGGTHTYGVRFAAPHQYLRVVVERRRSAPEVVLLGPTGGELARAGAGPRRGVRVLSAVTESAGEHRLRITAAPSMAAPERYGVWIDELRPASESDPGRVAAQRLFAEALELKERGTTETSELALARLHEALRSWRVMGDEHGTADALNEIGALEIDRGSPAHATSYLEQGLAAARASGYAAGEAGILNSLGVAHVARGEARHAREQYEEALRLWERLGVEEEAGATLYNLGYLYFTSNELGVALEHYERALPLLREAGDLSVQARTLAAIGLAHGRLGDPVKALEFFHRALPLSRAAADVRTEAAVTGHIATTLRRRGEMQRALELYNAALGSFRRAGDRGLEASALQSLGRLYQDLGDWDRAEARAAEALRLYRETGRRRWEALALMSLGWSHHVLGDPALALTEFEQALALARDLEDRRIEASAFHNIGVVRLARGETAAAIEALRQALALRRATSDRAEEAATDLELGTAYMRAGELTRAAEHLERALTWSAARGYLDLEAISLLRRAELEREAGRPAAALRSAERALEIVESVRSRVVGQELRTSLLGLRRSFYDLVLDLHMRLEASEPQAGHAARALQTCERSRARGLLELVVEGKLRLDQGLAPELAERERDLDRRIAWVQSELLDALARERTVAQEVPALEAELREAQASRERLQWDIRRLHPGYAGVRYPAPLALDEIRSLLDESSALLEFCVGDERSYLFVVTRDGLSAFPLAPAKELEADVRELRAALDAAARAALGRYVRAAADLYRKLLAPAELALHARSRLLVSPDGALHLVPFEVLLTTAAVELTPSRLPYLIGARSVAYVPSATVLASLRQPRARPPDATTGEGLVAFAASEPVAAEGLLAPASVSDNWLLQQLRAAPLPAARREVQEIAHVLSGAGARLYIDREAVEENVKGNPVVENARRLHFAAHGFVNEEQPQLSGLLLGRRPGSAEDGLLQMYEVFNLRLAAESVVLSACETGLGKRVSGEGLITLARAFFHAGARSVVVSLWKVRDASTRDLMVRFYRGLDRGQAGVEALRSAKLQMIRDGRFAHPFYWAPFVLVGDAQENRL